jgi:hypothetical protein
MKIKDYYFGLLLFVLCLIIGICLNTPTTYAQDKPNTITFINKSGEFTKVKLIGSTIDSIAIPNEENGMLTVAAGKYYILVRYGCDTSKFNYFKGDPFSVIQTETEYSIISITLDSIKSGNHPIHPISKEEFERKQK